SPTPSATQATAKGAKSAFCSQCGTPLEKGDKFCSDCGAKGKGAD
ncbi:MAG: zinc-ribbon domain-containing protein, partial [Dehalococcoidia bacterium]